MSYASLADLYHAAPSTSAPHHFASREVDGNSAKTCPFKPRTLSLRERRDHDFHAFHSPKEERRIEVIGVSALCLALLHEFNFNIAAYTERPRLLLTSTGRHELAFWIRDRLGRERFVFIVPTKDSLPEKGGKRIHRRMDALQDAARNADIQLIFISEPDLMEQRTRITQALRMLPYVQDAMRLANRLFLRDRVMTIFEINRQARIADIEGSLTDFVPSDVRAVVCDLIHCGALALDPTTPLTMQSIVRLGVHHG